MSDDVEYRCFIGGLSWSTSDRGLKEAFEKFGRLVEAKVVIDRVSGRSRGFGFVTFGGKKAMDEAIDAMHGFDLDGRSITVEKAQPNQGSGRDYDNDLPRDRDRGRGNVRDREYGSGRGSSSGDCFKCGKPGHFARECPSDGGRSGRYGGREDRYGDRDRGRDHDGDREYGGGRGSSSGGDCFKCGKPGHFARECPSDGGRSDRYGGREDRYGGGGGGGGSGRGGPDRNGDRYGGRNRDNGGHGGGARYSRDRSGPYDR